MEKLTLVDVQANAVGSEGRMSDAGLREAPDWMLRDVIVFGQRETEQDKPGADGARHLAFRAIAELKRRKEENDTRPRDPDTWATVESQEHMRRSPDA